MANDVDEQSNFDAFVETIARLRAPGGCPWDIKQTHESIARHIIEEAYEAVEAIESGDVAHMREELGDLLEQVVLQAQIAADAGEFTIDDVAHDINQKIIRRHPHVFGDAQAATEEEVNAIWAQVKQAERTQANTPQGALDSVPQDLPALMGADKISRKMIAAGFDWENPEDVWDKVHEEITEYQEAPKGSKEAALEFGDMLFALVNVGLKDGIDAEMALRAALAKYRRRWSYMEQEARAQGRTLEDYHIDDLEALWLKSKASDEIVQ